MNHIRKLLHFVKPYWRRSLLALILLTTVVFLDLAIPRLIQRIIDQGITSHNMRVVVSTTIIMLVLSVLQTIFAVCNNILSVQVGEGVARDLREALFLKIQSFSYGNLDRLNTGQLMVRLSSDTNAFQRLVQVALRIGTRAPLLMVGSLVLMFHTDTRLAMLLLPVLLPTALVIVFFVSKMEPLFRTMQKKLDRLNTVLQENIAGVRLVKAFVRAEHEGGCFAESNDEYTRFSVSVMKFVSTLSPAMTIFVNIGVVVVIWAGGIQTIDDGVSVGQLVAFINYLQTAMGPLMVMVMLANVLAAGTASAERINEVLETIPEVRDEAHPLTLPEVSLPCIAFNDVGFRYNGSADQAVLENINLEAEPGQIIAILGATGSGKSSLINLIPRFFDVSSGNISLKGIDIRRISQDALLAHIGIVPQETVLFSGTVRDNIRYGRPNSGDEEVVAAAKAAQAHEFIVKLTDGYDTHIEERGVNLSGGQKQRIAIARALLIQPSILILDDSTSSVDVATDTRIQASLKEWMHGRTCFVVAQRISTVLNADKIVVMDQGRIAMQGTHAELMQFSPTYQEIYASQLGNGFPPDADNHHA
ncbi:MAG: ABC transporter ATP-binding protein [Pseudomonadota bacterium]